jgi:hypothetical protein
MKILCIGKMNKKFADTINIIDKINLLPQFTDYLYEAEMVVIGLKDDSKQYDNILAAKIFDPPRLPIITDTQFIEVAKSRYPEYFL